MSPQIGAWHAAWGAAAGPLDLSCLDGIDNSQTSRPKAAKQAPNPRSSSAQRNQAAGRRVRLQYLARRLHGLGSKPLFHFLDEVERGADLRPHLERYAALPADFIKAHGGDQFPPIVHVIDGGGE